MTLKALTQKVAELERIIHMLRNAPREENDKRIGPEHTTANEHNSTHGKVPLPTKIPPAPANSGKADKPWYKTGNGWKIALEIVAIPFAIGYAVVTYWQWHDLGTHFAFEQRAWLKADVTYPDSIPSVGSVVQSSITITNIGKSVSLHILADVGVEIVASRSAPLLVLTDPDNRGEYHVFFPNQHDDAPVYAMDLGEYSNRRHPLTVAEYTRLLGGDAYLVTFGQVLYTDSFGSHWTRFCAWKTYTSDRDKVTYTGFNASSCARFNAVGDGDAPPLGMIAIPNPRR
jgi:hypothetical protein